MFRYCIVLIAVGFMASQAAIHISDKASQTSKAPTEQVAVQNPEPAAVISNNKVSSGPIYGRSAVIKADDRGHFLTTARMNGRRVEVLVDTGATSVAINRSTARRLGIHLAASDFKYNVNTANGVIKAAQATIDRVEIGRVQVRDVRAMVISDKSLSGTLLGMSFLNELDQFQIKNGELLLKQ